MNGFKSGYLSLARTKNSLLSTRNQTLSFRKLSTEEVLSQSSYISEKIASFLENCSDVSSLRELHACIFVQGLGTGIFLGSKLLKCYAKFGLLAESRRVSDRIINRNLSLWNSIFVGYFRIGHFDEVLRRYLILRQWHIGLDSSAITFTLKSCIELRNLEFGEGVHGEAYKFGLNADGFVGSSLIGLYMKYGEDRSAFKVFDEVTYRDIVVYTSIITGYAQLGDYRAYGAFKVARLMQKENVDPNRVTLVSLLQAASHLESLEEGRSVHGYAIRRGIGSSDEVFQTSLMAMYNKCGSPRTAGCIFGKIDTRTIGSWNAMISGHLEMGQPLEAFKLFYEAVKENVMPDLVTLANGLLCCANLKYLLLGKSIHGYIIRFNVQLDLIATTALVDLYSKCKNLMQARELFNRMEKRDAIAYDVLMAGYLHCDFACEAMEIFAEMIGSGIRPNLGSILGVLSASSDLKDIRKGKCIHGYVVRHGFDLNAEIANQIIYMYAKCGCIIYARKVFNRMRNKDLVSWTSMMIGYVYNGHCEEATILFRLMQREKLDHDSVTLITLLQAFSQLGCLSLAKEVHCHLYRAALESELPLINSLIATYSKCGKLDMARNLFEHTIELCLTSWNTMIAAYGMHGKCIEALMLFDGMQKEGVEPDEVTFTSVLSACSHSGMINEGIRAFRSMVEEYSIIPCEEHYGCMVDLLSRAGQLEEAYNLIKCLPSRLSSSALGSLLAACRVHGNTEMGELIGRHILDLESENSSAYSMVSNMYAESGKWEDVVRVRNMVKERGLKRTPGYSLIELHDQVCEM
ncbi:hypothetical protein FNV43_RR14509 [Rhamnella rubrinervis]|uniref:Pentatricopeptide repeat-containing protein n=1 Tax=Rhamnella rubrinervis TaxID=2594499 RepID=A0A8K0MGB2_9ROSA|nr:hypothetical protein FNV43_RR14509 [Rhamnella rubrinervis]